MLHLSREGWRSTSAFRSAWRASGEGAWRTYSAFPRTRVKLRQLHYRRPTQRDSPSLHNHTVTIIYGNWSVAAKSTTRLLLITTWHVSWVVRHTQKIPATLVDYVLCVVSANARALYIYMIQSESCLILNYKRRLPVCINQHFVAKSQKFNIVNVNDVIITLTYNMIRDKY